MDFESRPVNPRWLIAAGAFLLVLVALWLAFPNGKGTRDPLTGGVVTEEKPFDPKPPAARLMEPAGSEARFLALESEQSAQFDEPDSPYLRLVYDDGRPAAGVLLYAAHASTVAVSPSLGFGSQDLPVPALEPTAEVGQSFVVSFPDPPLFSLSELGLRRVSPTWSVQSDHDGKVAFPRASPLAPIAAARLSADAVMLLPINLDQATQYVLPAPVPQEVCMEGQGGEPVILDAVLSSYALAEFLQGQQGEAPTEGFSDHNVLFASSLDSPHLAAYHPLQLTSTESAAVVDLPRGKYLLRVRSATFGWWARPVAFEAGARVVLHAYRVPKAFISSDRPGKPGQVLLKCQCPDNLHPPESHELDLPWEVQDGFIAVYMVPRETRSDCLYAIRVIWPSGEAEMTDYSSFSSLQGVLTAH